MDNNLQKEAESPDDSQQAGSGNVKERSSTVTQQTPFSSCVDPPCLQLEIENHGSTTEANDNGVTISRLTDEFESKDGK